MNDELIVVLIEIGTVLVLLVAISPVVFVAVWIHRWINRKSKFPHTNLPVP